MIDIDAALDLAAVAAAVRACPGVSALSESRWPGDDDARPGITVDEHSIEITVVAFYGRRLSSVVEQIETAIRPLIADRRLTVTIDDLDTRHSDQP